jgi:benzoyl-CoA reductase/2-hydroxyglutaryl-CoA dehydratase subunit BcrC/BadD/HgdB
LVESLALLYSILENQVSNMQNQRVSPEELPVNKLIGVFDVSSLMSVKVTWNIHSGGYSTVQCQRLLRFLCLNMWKFCLFCCKGICGWMLKLGLHSYQYMIEDGDFHTMIEYVWVKGVVQYVNRKCYKYTVNQLHVKKN